MRRIKIKLAYDGGAFHGWQVQPGLATIQGSLEQILSDMEGRPVHVAGSGRTDAGVHALEQVAAFTIANPIPLANLRRAVNRLLPPAIRVLSAEEVASDFHPRFDTHAKTYEYRILRDEVCSPFEWPYVHRPAFHIRKNLFQASLDGGQAGLDLPSMKRSAVVGQRDLDAAHHAGRDPGLASGMPRAQRGHSSR